MTQGCKQGRKRNCAYTRMKALLFLQFFLLAIAKARHLALYRRTDVFSVGVTFADGRESSMPSGDFTLSMWLRFRSRNGDARVVMGGYKIALDINNAMDQQSKPTLASYFDSKSYAVEMPTAVNGTLWENFAMRYVASTKALSFFRNGELLGTETTTSTPFGGAAVFGPNGIETLYFGLIADYINSQYEQVISSTGYPSPGFYDEFALWDSALSDANLASVYSNGRDPSQTRVAASNLVILYDMEEPGDSSVLMCVCP